MPRRFVITGGGGFVGKALGKALVARGDQVLSLARSDYPELRELGIETRSVDISCFTQRRRSICGEIIRISSAQM
jgi:nucleoside-diphosphate-sugar epimerase